MLGKNAPNLSPAVIARLTAGWEADYESWRHRDLSARRYVYVWADGVYLQARMEPTAECMLVVDRRDARGQEGTGRLPGRHPARARRVGGSCCVDLKARGLSVAPRMAVGDGALGFWKAMEQVVRRDAPSAMLATQDGQRAEQNAEVQAPKVKDDLREIGRRQTGRPPRRRSTLFAEKYGAKYRQGGRVSDQGPGRVADLLRLPGRALGSLAHVEPDRKRVRDGAPSHGADQGLAVPMLACW